MGIKKKFQERRQRNRNEESKAKAFEAAHAVSVTFALSLYKYFQTLPGIVNIETNLDSGPTEFFEFENEAPNWFGNTICFDYKTYSFRLYFAFQFNPDLPTIDTLIVNGGQSDGWPSETEPRRLYKYLSNFWIQLNVSKSYDPKDGKNSRFLVRFDASPHWKVDLFPLHMHTYDNNKDSDGLAFDGTRDQLIDVLQEMIENATFNFGPLNPTNPSSGNHDNKKNNSR